MKIISLFFIYLSLLNFIGCTNNKGCTDPKAYNYNPSVKRGNNKECLYSPYKDAIVLCEEYNIFEPNLVLVDRPNVEVDYVIPCLLAVSSELIIEPGVVIVFGENGGLKIAGKMIANGTPEKPIILKGSEDIGWYGITFENNNTGTLLKNVEIIGGGYLPPSEVFEIRQKSNAAIHLLSTAVANSISFTDVTISESKGFAISMKNNNNAINFLNVNLVNGYKSMFLSNPNLLNSITGLNMYNNDFNYVELSAKIYNGPITLSSSFDYFLSRNYSTSSPVHYFGTTSGANLTVPSGVTILMDSLVGIQSSGVLNMSGNSSNPIIIKGLKEVSGYWANIKAPINSFFTFTQIKDGGGGYNVYGIINCFNSIGNLIFTNNTLSNSFVNCAIQTNSQNTLSLTGTTFGNITNISCN